MAIAAGVFMSTQAHNRSSTLKVGFPYYWGNLTPSLQHTAYADTIIKNQFEPLVRFGSTGTIEPLAAKSWKISDDFRVFTFEVDNNRRFSDGTTLTASHFKRAWEAALSLQPKSANSSLQDLLYKVEGYDQFHQTGAVSGLVVRDETTFEVHFKTPFRMAIDRLCGGRFGVFLLKDGKYLGTGSYSFSEVSEKRVLLSQNPFAVEKAAFVTIDVTVVDPKNAQRALSEGTIDAYASADAAEIDSCDAAGGNIGCLVGAEIAHANLDVNGLPGRFFSNPQYRLALQTLITQALPSMPKPKRFEINGFRIDPQVFLPAQSGRLADSEAEAIIDRGKAYADDFIKATQSQPLYYVSRYDKDWLYTFLSLKGVRFTANSGRREFKQILEMSYKTSEPDLIMMGRSVANGDPDGIYHVMGKNGAILSPMAYRERVSNLLEEGRAILEQAKLHEYYQKVTRAILEEVPSVHLGFEKDVLAFRKDRVRVVEKERERKDFRFLVFEPR